MKNQKLGRNPFQAKAASKPAEQFTAKTTLDMGLPRPTALLRNLIIYFVAESTLQALKLFGLRRAA
jgi:hypothetical protein